MLSQTSQRARVRRRQVPEQEHSEGRGGARQVSCPSRDPSHAARVCPTPRSPLQASVQPEDTVVPPAALPNAPRAAGAPRLPGRLSEMGAAPCRWNCCGGGTGEGGTASRMWMKANRANTGAWGCLWGCWCDRGGSSRGG